MKEIVPVFLVAMMAALSGQAKAAEAVSAADRSFVAMVSQGGMFEVQLGQAAAERGSTQDIKDQGATEEHDHALVGVALKLAAGAAGITFPDLLNADFKTRFPQLPWVALSDLAGLCVPAHLWGLWRRRWLWTPGFWT